MLDKFKLDGKTALVTGASRGIGQAMAEALAAAGADIIGVSLSDPASETRQRVEALGRKYASFDCDFSDRKDLYRFIGEVTTKFPEIDILANNAGHILRQPIAEHSDEYWDRIIEINQNSQFILTREIGKRMLARGRGKIIFTASLLTFQGGILVPGYAASKGAVGQLTKAFANEWAGKGVNVNAIAPGYVATDNTAALRADPDRSASILARIPAGRWAEPEDFKGPIVFLASAASDYVHGAILLVDGGWMGR